MEQYIEPTESLQQVIEHEEPEENYRLVLSTVKGTYFFLPNEIVRMEARSNYTQIYFSNHHPMITSRVLKEYEALLEPHGFLRTHRSHLVNKSMVVEVDNRGKLVMQDQSTAEISRRKKNKVMKALRA